MAKLGAMFGDMGVKKQELHPKRVTKWIHYSKLRENQRQYRCGKTPEEQENTRRRVAQLADLIEADGEVLQDLLVRKADTDEYEIISGHHRALACRLLAEERGKEEYAFLPCIVRNVSDVHAEFALYSSNGYDAKTDYEIMCELEGMKHLLETYPEEFPDLQTGRMVERLSKQMHMPKTTVGEYLKIAKNLGGKSMEKFQTGEIKKSAAVELASFSEEEQEELIDAGITTHKQIEEYKDMKKAEPALAPVYNGDEPEVCDVAQPVTEEEQIQGQMCVEDFPELLPTLDAAHDESWFVKKYVEILDEEAKRIMEAIQSASSDSDKAHAVQKYIAPYGCHYSSHDEYSFNFHGFAGGIDFGFRDERIHMKYGRFVKELEKLYEQICDITQEESCKDDSISDMELAQELIQEGNKLLADMRECCDDDDVIVRRQKILVSALTGYITDLNNIRNLPSEPKQPEFPIFRNNAQRKEWLRNYETWGLWYEDKNIGCRYYKYDFDNGARLIAEVYHVSETEYINAYNNVYFHLIGGPEPPKGQYGVGKWSYHTTYSRYPNSETELVEFLKYVQSENGGKR